MTAKKPLPEIAAKGKLCRSIRVGTGPVAFYVREDRVGGWIGPSRQTARGAVLAWNRVMERPKAWLNHVRKLLCLRLAVANKTGGIDAMFAEMDKIRRGE